MDPMSGLIRIPTVLHCFFNIFFFFFKKVNFEKKISTADAKYIAGIECSYLQNIPGTIPRISFLNKIYLYLLVVDKSFSIKMLFTYLAVLGLLVLSGSYNLCIQI